eukprot:6368-Alexandrium_andersonii.AAC.1
MQRGEAANGVENKFEVLPMNSSEYGDCKGSKEGVLGALNWLDDLLAEMELEAQGGLRSAEAEKAKLHEKGTIRAESDGNMHKGEAEDGVEHRFEAEPSEKKNEELEKHELEGIEHEFEGIEH